MMKKSIVATCVLLLALTLNAIKSYAETPLEFNNRLAAITDSLYTRGGEWSAKFKELSETKNYKELAPLRISMQAFIDKKIAELKTTKGVGKGAPEFIKTMIEFLNFEKGLTVAFVPFEKFTSATSDEEIQKTMDKMTAEAQKEDEVLKKVNAAQEAYGQKNGFAIEETKPDAKETE